MQKAQEIDTSNVFGKANSTAAVSGIGFSHKHLVGQPIVETPVKPIETASTKVDEPIVTKEEPSVVDINTKDSTVGESEGETKVEPVNTTTETPVVETTKEESVEATATEEMQHINNVTLTGNVEEK